MQREPHAYRTFHSVNDQVQPKGTVASMHEDILRKCIQGDAHAQMQIYQLYAKAMYNTAYRMMQDRHEAEDVMQEAFMTAFQHLASLQERSTFPAWLKRIVVNTCLNAIKAKQHYEGIKEEWEPLEEEAPNDADFPMSYEEVKAAIAALPSGYRTVLTLYLLEGYDHEEIADILGVASATSRSQYNRGKRTLKERLMNMT